MAQKLDVGFEAGKGGEARGGLPKWVALVESEAGIDDHGHPERDEDDEEHQVPALPVVPYDTAAAAASDLAIPVAPRRRRVPPYDRP